MTKHKSLADFIQRTKDNLTIIYNPKDKTTDETYEVTQLINSLLGLLVLPQQKFFDEIKKKKVIINGTRFPKVIQTVQGGTELNAPHEKTMEFSEIIRHLRNSITHFKVNFINEDELIKGVQFTDDNKDYVNKYDEWVLIFDTISKLKIFVEDFSNQIIEPAKNKPPL
ncbi:MAG: hypothetical protein C4541_05435 [Candidatus Auribacter fodinae]|jgi:hypothetical protein|uniref:pEK499-p136 HEPN domain-containing protein n=1 Tax=Candidatus Auribacter fodinae TaxID=2093366 RepID=A0A3A4RAL6_9BACT|nr:MAG: hypothetical protein C4541_05435 [Candidatus Auribacter fodinae]